MRIPWTVILTDNKPHRETLIEYLDKFDWVMYKTAKYLGVSDIGLRTKLRKEHIVPKKKATKVSKILDFANKNNTSKMYAKNIAEIFGYNPSTVRYVFRKYNIPYKKVPPGFNLYGNRITLKDKIKSLGSRVKYMTAREIAREIDNLHHVSSINDVCLRCDIEYKKVH